jgi:hypothetical protein
MAAEPMETEYCDNDAERRALKSALVGEIRKRKAAGLKVNVLMRELHKLDDPFGGIGIRGTETAGRSARHAAGKAEVITQRDLASE